MRIKTFAAILFAALVLPIFVSARTEAEIRSALDGVERRIAEAQQEKQALLAELAAAIGSDPAAASCTVLTRNIPGASVTKAEILKLQAFLIAQGDLAAAGASGVFDDATSAAVQRFQSRQGIVFSGTPATTGYGAVGPATRGKIRELSCQLNTNSLLRLLTPNGGGTYRQGEELSITWENPANDTVDIRLRGPDARVVAMNHSGNSTTWTIPKNLPSGNYSVRIQRSSQRGTNIWDESDAAFAIRGAVTVTAPNGGETFAPGGEATISWTTQGTLSNSDKKDDISRADERRGSNFVRILLLKGGAVVSTLGTMNAEAGTFKWKIPAGQTLGSDYTVRVTDAGGDAQDDSDAAFSIGFLTNAPRVTDVKAMGATGDSTINVGNTLALSWVSENIATLRVSLYRSGSFVRDIDASVPASQTGMSWTVPAGLQPSGDTADYVVRVASKANASIFGETEPFKVLSHAITLTKPNGGETLQPGSESTITWTTDGSVATAKIYLLKGATNPTVTKLGEKPGSAGSFTWRVPLGQALGGDYRIRVTSGDEVAVDESNEAFSIGYTENAPAVSGVTVKPQGTDTTVNRGNTVTVAYTSQNIQTLKIGLYRGGEFVQWVDSSVPSTRTSVSWNVPSNITPSGDTADYVVRVVSSANASIYAESAAFKILASTITVTAPNGGERFEPGTTAHIAWQSDGKVGNVSIQLIKGSGAPHTIEPRIPATRGSYSWDIPRSQTLGNDYKIRVVRSEGAQDESDAAFSVGYATPPIKATAALQNNVVKVNWTVVNGVAANVKIDLVKQDGTFVRTIRASAAAASGGVGVSYTIPATVPNGTYKARVTSLSNISLFADTETFEVTGHTALLDPASQTASAIEALSALVEHLQTVLSALSRQ